MARSRLLSVIVVVAVASLGGVTTAAAQPSSGEDPGITCSPADPPAGGQLNCTAEGLGAASEAAWTASFAGGTEEGGTETADDNGRAQFKVDVPDEPGAYTVTVTGTAADGGAYEESFSGTVKGTGPDEGDAGDEGEGGEGGEGDDGQGGEGDGEGDSRDNQAGGQEKIGLCHATASATNPYVYTEVGAPAATKGGHAKHEGDLIDGRDGEFDGPEDCPFEASKAAVACVSTAGLAVENPVLCRAKNLQPLSPFQFNVLFGGGGSTGGAGVAESDGVARFDFRAPEGEFTVVVRGIAPDAAPFEESAAGVAGVTFDDEAPAPAPQVEATPVGGVAAGHGGTADDGLPFAAIAVLLLTIVLLASATVPVRRRGGGSRR